MDGVGDTHWDAEKEGQLVQLLRQLAGARGGDEEETLLEQLREQTGQDLEGGLRNWLSWYFEDHLGIRPVIGILTGQEVWQEEREESEPVLLDGDVFVRPEYNWCAIERIHNRDDMVKLRQLYSDLEMPVRIDAEGPFSFVRLTGLSDDELEYFRGRSISEAIFAQEVRMSHLRALKDYGKLMMMPVLPSATQRAGAIIYAAAIAKALVHFDTKISSLSYQTLTESLGSLIERPYIVESYLKLFRDALEKCR